MVKEEKERKLDEAAELIETVREEGGEGGEGGGFIFYFSSCPVFFPPFLLVNCLYALILSSSHMGAYIHVYIYMYVHVLCTFVNVHLYVKTYKHVLYMYIYVKVCVYSDSTASSATGGNRY